ncbi:MAG: ABC transporter permease, partial [Candidatus Diapherotrites archaeon]|nr:ABC transporter permease [Candidatus Diapherotrites archaeon]
MLGIASKNLLRNKSRTALAMLGLVLGVITIISLVSITTGVKGIVEDTVSKMKGLSITEKDISMPVFSELPEEYADDIEGIAGVRVACPRIAFFPKSVEGKGYYELATGPVIAFDPAKEARTVKGPLPISADLYKGRYLKPNDRNAVVIGKSIAEDFHKTIGSKMEMNDEKFDVVGIYSSESEQTERQIFVTLDIGRDFGNLEAGKVRGFYVELEDPSKDQQIAKLIEIKLDDVDAQSTSEYAAQALGLLENINIFMWAISLVATAVASVGIINTMLMSVMERMKEFGVLRSMG